MLRQAALFAAAALAAGPLAAADAEHSAKAPIVELSINESVEATPDLAEISAGVTTDGETAVAAMQDNARAMTAVIERIKALGVEEKDIQTSGISLNPRYDYDQTSGRQIFRGYQVANRVQVTLRQIERVCPTLDALVQAGATDLSGPNWSVDDPSAARRQARERAMTTGRERALEYARLAGFADVRLLRVSEAVPFDRPLPFMRLQAMDAAAASPSTPVQPGQVETGVTISVTYELVS